MEWLYLRFLTRTRGAIWSWTKSLNALVVHDGGCRRLLAIYNLSATECRLCFGWYRWWLLFSFVLRLMMGHGLASIRDFVGARVVSFSNVSLFVVEEWLRVVDLVWLVLGFLVAWHVCTLAVRAILGMNERNSFMRRGVFHLSRMDPDWFRTGRTGPYFRQFNLVNSPSTAKPTLSF
jgi:hypothetical protein